MIKCICLIRVSTQQQILEGQKDKVIAEAIHDGYSKEEIKVIEAKESAIKLAESERETLTEMKQIITMNSGIESLYVFAIDRLARKVSTVLSIKDYLLENNINLVFIHPHRMSTMRKNDKGIMVEDELTSLMLLFLGYGAEMEMKLKQARIKTTRDVMRANNKLCSGRPMFGYRKDSDKSVVVDEVTGKAVRDVFHLYNENRLSMQEIYNLLVSRGLFKDKKKSAAKNTILRILKNKAYTGDYSSDDKVKNIKYPPIIDKELYDRTQELLKERFFAPKKLHKNIYYAKGLLRLEQTGYIMQTHITNICYKSFEVYKCSININAVDTSVWQTAKILFMIQNEIDRLETPYDYKEEISECEERIKNIEKLIEDSRQKQKKAFKMYLDGMVDETIYNSEVTRLKESEATWSSEIASIETEINRYRMMNTESNERGVINPRNLDALSDKQRKEMIDSLIEEIRIKHEDDGSFTWVFIPKNKKVLKIYKEMNNSVWRYKTHGGKMFLEETGDKWSNQVNIENRIGGHKLL